MIGAVSRRSPARALTRRDAFRRAIPL